jgi:hypothetical protein
VTTCSFSHQSTLVLPRASRQHIARIQRIGDGGAAPDEHRSRTLAASSVDRDLCADSGTALNVNITTPYSDHEHQLNRLLNADIALRRRYGSETKRSKILDSNNMYRQPAN